jgi:hypothetical protein
MYVNDYVLSYLSQGCKLHPIFAGAARFTRLKAGASPRTQSDAMDAGGLPAADAAGYVLAAVACRSVILPSP